MTGPRKPKQTDEKRRARAHVRRAERAWRRSGEKADEAVLEARAAGVTLAELAEDLAVTRATAQNRVRVAQRRTR